MGQLQFTKLPQRNNEDFRHNQELNQFQQESERNDDGFGFIQKKPQKQKDHSFEYRADIDGLRTIAVMGVIIFHAWPKALTGGFVGVDVFFVISGYLISSIIIKKCQKKEFSFIDFYQRRIKRIYPALLVVLVFILLICFFKLLPRQIKMISKTMSASSTVFCANIQIMLHHATYFDPWQNVNAVLHLWSLGVEEQFYIIWPMILYLTINKAPRQAFNLLLIFTIGCFIYSIYLINTNVKMAFYFPWGRFWQLSAGGLVAFKNLQFKTSQYSTRLSVFGLLSICITMIFLTGDNLFPGWWAIPPTLGAVSVILAGQQAFLNKHILSSAPFVFIGKISYPLYLWHWPLLTFSRLLFPMVGNSIFQSIQVVIVLSFILSFLTYELVENKVRFRRQKIVVIILILCMCVIGITSYSMYKDPQSYSPAFKQMQQQQPHFSFKPGPNDFVLINGKMKPNSSKNKNRQRPTPSKIRYSMADSYYFDQSAHIYQDANQGTRYFEQTNPQHVERVVINQKGKKQVFVIGDSHSQRVKHRYSHLWSQSIKNNQTQIFPAIHFISQFGLYLPSSPFFNYSLQHIIKHKPERVIIVNHWLMYVDFKQNNPWDSDEVNTIKMKQKIKQISNSLKIIKEKSPLTELYIVGLKLSGQKLDPRNMLNFYGVVQNSIKPIKYSEFRQSKKEIFQEFQSVVKSANATIIDFAQHECWEDICEVMTPAGLPILSDSNHDAEFYSANWASAVDEVLDFQQS